MSSMGATTRMSSLFNRSTKRKRQRRGMVSLEWILIITVMVIGVIGGLGAIRVAVNGELEDLAEAVEAINFKTDAQCADMGMPPGCG